MVNYSLGTTEDVRCFFSYRHADNDQLNGVVDRIKDSLSAVYEARTGNTLAVFLDKESIGWGANWREEIQKAIQGAMVFVPILTMRYFKSAECCDEFMTFYRSASRLGVTDLLLPIVLTGAENIRSDHPQEEVRIIAGIQYKSLEKAWIAGIDSPEWRSAMVDVADSLDSAITSAEMALATSTFVGAPASSEHESPGSSAGLSEGADAQSSISDVEVQSDIGELTEKVQEIPHLLEEITQVAEDLSEVTNDLGDEEELAKLTPGQMTFRLGAIAERLKKPAKHLETKGADLQRVTSEVDHALRSLLGEMKQIDHPLATQQLDEMRPGLTQMNEIAEPLRQTQDLISVLRVVSLTNVNVRRALQPALRGLQNIEISMSTMQSWQMLVT